MNSILKILPSSHFTLSELPVSPYPPVPCRSAGSGCRPKKGTDTAGGPFGAGRACAGHRKPLRAVRERGNGGRRCIQPVFRGCDRKQGPGHKAFDGKRELPCCVSRASGHAVYNSDLQHKSAAPRRAYVARPQNSRRLANASGARVMHAELARVWTPAGSVVSLPRQPGVHPMRPGLRPSRPASPLPPREPEARQS